ncbi:EAL domain-containing protein [Pelomonas sp. SE-A7]|uniref:putative bifunctional diguanylate cyclase/phosphodiesterase n=1 Tax=Pelomonas sp. SE-A7 TaxID=3054953 RepID=UPI00259C875B|nr:EAL domain-containing protein [Pelomonas sp. SE-A7]MDM4766716.1 EAL domain-containing protein [Pelomonas sp. SE-A7]
MDEDRLQQEIAAARLRLIADNVPALIALYDARTDLCLFANRQYAQTFGLDERSILGRSFGEVIGPDATEKIQWAVDKVKTEHQAANYERQLDDGRWIEVNLIPHLDDAGTLIASCVLINDISKHRNAEKLARETQQRLDKFMHATVEGILFHRDGVVTDVNPPLCALVGYSLEEMIGRQALAFVAEDELAKVQQVMSAARELRYETAVVHKDGTRIPVEFIVRTMEMDGERHRMTIVRDIRDRVAAQARIQHLAHHDSLTQLLNRSAFMERLQPALDSAASQGHQLGLLFIDLDNFKRVNDSLGHLEGDQVLTTVSRRITGCLRSSDLVGRFGGDEFVVLLEDVHHRDDVLVVLQALLEVVEVPVFADGRELSVTPSIGVALFPEHGETAQELIQHADTAMYRAKAKGRATYEFFAPDMAESAYADLVIESELSAGLDEGEFLLYYQPQVDARSGRLVGAEALLRWRHPQRGLLTPEAFIAVAERHRLMLPLSDWVLAEAARQARRWHDAGLPPLRIAVNLSSMQFRLDSFACAVAQVLEESGASGEWLELELTERMLIDDIDHAPETLARLRAQGLSISVDDFGTGHTSLAHLTQLPLDKLKIDQGFVAKLPEDAGAMAITRAITEMARGLNFKVGAEGVRTDEQRRLLQEWGCHELQGELFAVPMPAAEFERWLRQREEMG